MAAIVADRVDEILFGLVALAPHETELAATWTMKTLMDHGRAPRAGGLG
jgi:hypothetical protein